MTKSHWLLTGIYALGVVFLPSVSFSFVPTPPKDFLASPDFFIKDIEAYLNGISTLKANLQQKNPDGTVWQGRLFLSRMGKGTYGKLRLEYTPPAKDLIIVDGRDLVHYDTTTNETNTYSVSTTPAAFLLKKNLHFKDDFSVKDSKIEASQGTLTFVKKEDEEGLSVSLVFQIKPFLMLKEWIVYDAQGKTTHVFLSNVEIGTTLKESLFDIR